MIIAAMIVGMVLGVYAGLWIGTGFIYIITRFEKNNHMRDFNKCWLEEAIYKLTFGVVKNDRR